MSAVAVSRPYTDPRSRKERGSWCVTVNYGDHAETYRFNDSDAAERFADAAQKPVNGSHS